MFTKVIEDVLLSRLQNWLSTTCSQFGFEAKHGTEMCVFILKELIRYYIEHGFCMYVTYLDVDRVLLQNISTGLELFCNLGFFEFFSLHSSLGLLHLSLVVDLVGLLKGLE